MKELIRSIDMDFSQKILEIRSSTIHQPIAVLHGFCPVGKLQQQEQAVFRGLLMERISAWLSCTFFLRKPSVSASDRTEGF